MAPNIPLEFTGLRESRNFSVSQMMGRTRKVSKGHFPGFVPDYQHAVETIGESEGFGSLSQVDTEMILSEDLCAPKRKCISLNAEGRDSFGVPIQVFSVSKMSRSERKDLELRLKMELQQVRVLLRKVTSLSSDVAVLSASCDRDGQKRSPLDNNRRSSTVPTLKRKNQVPPGRNKPCMKSSHSGQFETVKQVVSSRASNVGLMKECETLLNRLMLHKHGWVFNAPVDVVKLNIPDYFSVIKHPMDLGTVKNKIASGEYLNPLDFAEDVRLTFSNAMTYNPPKNDVHFMAATLSKFFEVRWKSIEKKLLVRTEAQVVPASKRVQVKRGTSDLMPPLEKQKVTVIDDKIRPECVRRVMTNEEKHKLSMELEALLGELPERIIDFLTEQSSNDNQTSEDEIEIDIDALNDDTLFTLRKLLDDYLREKQINQGKVEPCDMEVANESRFSNLSLQPGKDGEQVDNDVDIGENDNPVLSYPTVETNKNVGHKSSDCHGSSSSGSESVSISSGSDSDSSPASESGGAKARVLVSATKESPGSESYLDQKRGNIGDPDIENRPANELGKVEQDSQTQSISVEADGNQEGESAPSERQVSPDRLYRAALLRSRFADTILKAREKALEKGELRDPEKMRIEREELERRQREEKARLQAEAKMAEEARKKAEAEAAAEARRKRELEREAARQALQEMEKTVDIDENSQFMEDLEMLRTAPAENLPNFTDEISPDQLQDGMGNFQFQGSINPLEQLGLYIKADDDEDEEELGEPQDLPGSASDVEEGEID